MDKGTCAHIGVVQPHVSLSLATCNGEYTGVDWEIRVIFSVAKLPLVHAFVPGMLLSSARREYLASFVFASGHRFGAQSQREVRASAS